MRKQTPRLLAPPEPLLDGVGPDANPAEVDPGQGSSHGRVALAAVMGVVVMFFAALTSVFVERVLVAGDGVTLQPPPPIWFSTFFLLLASGAMIAAGSTARRGRWPVTDRWLVTAGASGFGFTGSQLLAWQHLFFHGAWLQRDPRTAFFYLLTFLHVLHLLGGVGWLLVLRSRLPGLRPLLQVVSAQASARYGPEKKALEGVTLCGVFWHFLGGLWLYLFALLFIA